MSRTPFCTAGNNDNGQLPARIDKDFTLIRSRRFFKLRGALSSWGLLIILICFTPAAGLAQNAQSGLPSPVRQGLSPSLDDSLVTRAENSERLSPKQKQSIVHANLEKSKRDATELAALAKELREELNKPNVDALSLEVVNRIERIGKLAKRIRDETKGF